MYYEYECHKHGIFEVKLLMSDVTLEKLCPVCGMLSVRKFSPLAFHMNWVNVSKNKKDIGL